MTNTQTKVARLTARVERVESALLEIELLAGPLEPDAPVVIMALNRLRSACHDIRAEQRAKGNAR